MGAFLFLLLLFIPPLLAMKSENTPSRSFDGGISPVIGNDPMGDLTSIDLFADTNDIN